jgi:Ca-activated chloride channel family protein
VRQRRLLLGLLGWSLLLLAAAQPMWIGRYQDLPVSSRDLMLLVDISGSMRQMDFTRDGEAVDRLSMVKWVAGRFIERRDGDRVGLILFGARPYLRAPLSYDHGAIRQLLEEAEIALAGEQTAIGDAIGLGIKRLQNMESDSRVLVLLTDGANNEGRLGPRLAARLAQDAGIHIYTIGIGRRQDAGPNPYGVWSAAGAGRFEQAMLQQLANETGGHYFQVQDSTALEAAYRSLDRLEPALGKAAREYVATPLYPWPLSAAMLVSLWLLLSPGMSGQKRRTA